MFSYLFVFERQNLSIQSSPETQRISKHDSFWNKHILTNVIQYTGGRVLSAEELENITIASVNQCRNRKFLVFKCDGASLCGGIGDRQKGIISAFLLSLLTNRTFVIDISKPCKLEKFLQPTVYNWTLCKKYISTLHKNSSLKLNFLFKDRKILKDIQNVDFDRNWTAQVVVVRINTYLIDKIKQHNYTKSRLNWLLHTSREETIHKIMHTLFRPSQKMLEEAANFYNIKVQGKHLVCSHIRMGKNPTIPKDHKLLRGAPNDTRILEFLKRYDHSRKYAIYIATDSDEVRRDALANIKSYININRQIVHVDRRMNLTAVESCEGLYSATFEQFILTLCDTLVLTRSGFGAMSAYMRGVSDNIFLYNPNTRTVGKYNLTDIQRIFKFH